jgi:hypothetical protein
VGEDVSMELSLNKHSLPGFAKYLPGLKPNLARYSVMISITCGTLARFARFLKLLMRRKKIRKL